MPAQDSKPSALRNPEAKPKSAPPKPTEIDDLPLNEREQQAKQLLAAAVADLRQIKPRDLQLFTKSNSAPSNKALPFLASYIRFLTGTSKCDLSWLDIKKAVESKGFIENTCEVGLEGHEFRGKAIYAIESFSDLNVEEFRKGNKIVFAFVKHAKALYEAHKMLAFDPY